MAQAVGIGDHPGQGRVDTGALWGAQGVDRLGAGLHGVQAQIMVLGHPLDALGEHGIAGDQQGTPRVAHGRQIADHLEQGNFEPERSAAPHGGMHADAAVHQVDDALADGQAQPGAAIQARGGRIGLAEGLEQARLQGIVDADPAVGDLEPQLVLRVGLALALHAQPDLATLGELDRIDQQVAQYLAQAHRVATDGQAYRRVEFERELQAFRIGGALHQLHQTFEQLAQVERGDLQVQALGLEPGVIEDVIDDAQQLLRAGGGGLQHLALVTAELAARDQIEHRQDAVERRADLVAHGGQELTLGQRRGFGGLLGAEQFLFQLVLLLSALL